MNLLAEPLLLMLQSGLSPGNACRYYGLYDTIGSTANISELYNMLQRSNVENAYIAAYNGDFNGVVLSNTGAITPYRPGRTRTYHVFCEQGNRRGRRRPGLIGEENPTDGNMPMGEYRPVDNKPMGDNSPVNGNMPMGDTSPVEDGFPMGEYLPIEDGFPMGNGNSSTSSNY